MKSITQFIGAAAALFLGWIAFQQFVLNGPTVQQHGGGFQFPQNIQLPGGFQLPAGLQIPGLTQNNGYAPPATGIESIRIGSFNIQDFGESKVRRPDVMELLVRIGRQFDVLAVQEIQSKQYDVVALFVEQLNADGSQYDYVIGPRVGRGPQKEQFAYIFDRRSIEVDRNALYTIDDPQDLLAREPLVGWFRVRGPAPHEAFTFTLVSVHTDPDFAEQEVNVLDQVFRAVRDDARQEDDVIILGDFNVNQSHLGRLGQMPGAVSVINGYPTMVRGQNQNDNIVFAMPATREFTGRGGVFDYLRDYNLTQQQALLVSDHLPIWAEFSVYEGGRPGQVASPMYGPGYGQPITPYR